MDFSFFYQILNYKFLANSVLNYILLFSLLLIGYPISKSINYILNNYILIIVQETKIKLDDVMINSINPSITMFVYAEMFYLGTYNFTGLIKPILDKTLNFMLIIPIVYFLIKFLTEFVKLYLEKDNLSKRNEAAIDLLIQIIRIILVSIGILIILANLGYDVSTLIAGLGIGGLAFALAAQDVLKNFFAGIALILDKTFGKREKINFEENSGIIESIGLRSTKLRTYDGTLLTIPNSTLSDNIVENITKVPRVRIKMTLGLVYGTSSKKLKKAKQIIQSAIENQDDADNDSTTIFFDNFGAYSLDIKVYYYAKVLTMSNWKKWVKMKEDINFEILEQFEKAKIEFAFPTQTIELKK